MAVFFLDVGLEIRYGRLKGEPSDPRKRATPALAARRRKILAQTRADTHTAQANIDPA
jgi:Na+/H+ antiporter NhaA